MLGPVNFSGNAGDAPLSVGGGMSPAARTDCVSSRLGAVATGLASKWLTGDSMVGFGGSLVNRGRAGLVSNALAGAE